MENSGKLFIYLVCVHISQNPTRLLQRKQITAAKNNVLNIKSKNLFHSFMYDK